MSNTVQFALKIKENLSRVSKKLGSNLDSLTSKTKQVEKTGTKAFSSVSKQLDGSNKLAKKTTGILSGLEKQYKNIEKARDAATNPSELAKFNRELDKTAKKLEGFKKLGVQKSKSQQLKGSLMDALPGAEMLSNPYAAVGAGVLAVGAAAVKATQHLFSISSAVKQSQADVRSQFDLTGQALINTTAKFSAMSKVMNVDQKELTQTANAFFKEYKSEGATLVGSLKLIKEGLQGTNGALDLNNLQEYSSQMRQLGLTQEQFIALQVKAYKGGFYQDKPIDALKEAGLSIREMDKAQQEALAGIGVNYKKLLGGLNSGKLTGFDVVKQISEKMNSEKDVTKKQKIIADIFKGAGEDAGQRFFKEMLSGKLEMKGLLDATNPLIKSQERRLELETEISKKVQSFAPAFNSVSSRVEVLTLKAKSFAYGVVAKVVGWLQENKQTLGEITSLVQSAFAPAWEVAKVAIGGVWFAIKRTFSGIWKGVQLVNSAFIGLRKLTNYVVGGIGQGVDWLYKKFGGEGSLMEKLFGGTDSLWTGIKAFFDKLAIKFKAITGIANNAFQVVNSALRMDFDGAQKGWTKLKSDFKKDWSSDGQKKNKLGGVSKDPLSVLTKNLNSSKNKTKTAKTLTSPISPVSPELSKGAEGINGGGAKQTNITINLGKFMDNLIIKKEGFQESADEMELKLKEMLLRIINSSNQATAQ